MNKLKNKENLPWVEKYRPDTLDTIISHKDIIKTIDNLINNSHFPHMIFYGPPGTGKTTTILAAAKKLYGKNYHSMILELNGSDDRGINVVRDQIKDFSSTTSKISNIFKKDDMLGNIKLVILDEADSMTYDAQFALRRVIELYTETTRFCLICNYLTKIIPALQSRCMLFRFSPIKFTEHYNKICDIVIKENMKIDINAIEQIILLADGDMRKSLNVLQSLSMSYKKDNIILKNVYDIIGYPSEYYKIELLKYLFNYDIKLKIKYNKIKEIVNESNYSIIDIIREIINFLINKNIRDLLIKYEDNIIDIINELSKIEIYTSNNTNNDSLLLSIISIINLKKIYLDLDNIDFKKINML